MTGEILLLIPEDIQIEESPMTSPEPPAKKNRDPEKLKQYRDTHRAKMKALAPKKAAKTAKPKKKVVKAKKKAEEPYKSNRGPKGWKPEDRRRDGNKKWGLMLRKKRLELGYTQAQFAEFFNILQPHMCNLEKGTFNPGPKLREIIEKKFFRHVGLGKPRKG